MRSPCASDQVRPPTEPSPTLREAPATNPGPGWSPILGSGAGAARRCKNIPAARWLDVVAGFTVINDVSVPDWHWRTPTFTMGKSFDTHGPMGPFW